MRYIEQSEREVLDTLTNLVWQISYKTNLKFNEALEYVKQMTQETGQEWRVPTLKELLTLVDIGCHDPASAFPDMPPLAFWSSSQYVGDSYNAWFVDFDYGNVSLNYRFNSLAVRLVRCG